MNYRSVSGEARTERIVEKSRFLGYCAHAAGEEEARAFLSRVRRSEERRVGKECRL